MTPEEEKLYRTCVWREASGEGVAGMRAVAWIIWNRHRRWAKTIKDVIMERNQFTSMSVDKNPRNPEPDDLQMAEATTIVHDIVTGADTIDPIKGALYYANLAAVRAENVAEGRDPESGWFFENIVRSKQHPQLAVIGRHTFYA